MVASIHECAEGHIGTMIDLSRPLYDQLHITKDLATIQEAGSHCLWSLDSGFAGACELGTLIGLLLL